MWLSAIWQILSWNEEWVLPGMFTVEEKALCSYVIKDNVIA